MGAGGAREPAGPGPDDLPDPPAGVRSSAGAERRVPGLPVSGSPGEALERLELVPRDRPGFVVVRPGEVSLVEGAAPASEPLERLDVTAVDRLPLEGVTYTPSLREAEAAIGDGRARAAFLVRAPTVAEVQAIARAGQTMPEKSTYFYPKLVSGLLFSPLDE